MSDRPPTVEPMSRDECIHLLSTQEIGRLAVVDGDRPLIFPVNFVSDGDRVVIRTGGGTKLDASRLQRVAFEVDHFDTELRSGWSVVVQGIGHDVTDALDPVSERLRSLPLAPWPAGDHGHLIRIDPEKITGRRLGTPPPAPVAE